MTAGPLPSDWLWRSLKEGSEFFQHEVDIYATLRHVVNNPMSMSWITALPQISIFMTPSRCRSFGSDYLGVATCPHFPAR
jgi:hypothetical protein